MRHSVRYFPFVLLLVSTIVHGQTAFESASLQLQTKLEQVIPSAGEAVKDKAAVATMTRSATATGWTAALRSVRIEVTGIISRIDPATGQPVSMNIVFKMWGPEKYRI